MVTGSWVHYSVAAAIVPSAALIAMIHPGRRVQVVRLDRRLSRTEIRPMQFDLSLAPGPV
jgi:hypothetical protein